MFLFLFLLLLLGIEMDRFVEITQDSFSDTGQLSKDKTTHLPTVLGRGAEVEERG